MKLLPESEEFIKENYQTMSNKELGEALGRTERAIESILSSRGYSRGANNEANQELILKTVCDYYGLTREDLVSQSRKHEIVEARRMAIYLLCIYTTIAQVAIVRIFKLASCTTVTYAKDQMVKSLEFEENRAVYRVIIAKLGNIQPVMRMPGRAVERPKPEPVRTTFTRPPAIYSNVSREQLLQQYGV